MPDGLPQDDIGTLQHVDANTSYYYWRQIGKFCVQNGRKVDIAPLSNLDPSLLRIPLLGPIMATVLLQRGLLTLHASAVVIENEALLFVGDRGWGKSTLAAMLHDRGHGFLTDDVAALQVTPAPAVLPAFPRLKLWPETISLLENDPEDVPRLIDGYEKRDYRVQQRFMERPHSLARIYILSDGPETAIEPLSPMDALLSLLPHTFANRFGWNQDEARKTREFRQLTDLLKCVRPFRLRRPRMRAPLETVAHMLEEHAQLSGSLSLAGVEDGPKVASPQ